MCNILCFIGVLFLSPPVRAPLHAEAVVAEDGLDRKGKSMRINKSNSNNNT